tara:strand:- start:404 stop:796 length:393 start_codon:yes stop_codon:yes gene_type:complete
MYSAENYFWGWTVYTFGVGCVLSCLWYLLRKVSITSLRHNLLLIAVVFLLTPVTAYQDDSHLAPAFFVSLYEGWVIELGFQRGFAPILAMTLLSLMLFIISRMVFGKIRKPPRVRVRPAFSSDKRRRSNL